MSARPACCCHGHKDILASFTWLLWPPHVTINALAGPLYMRTIWEQSEDRMRTEWGQSEDNLKTEDNGQTDQDVNYEQGSMTLCMARNTMLKNVDMPTGIAIGPWTLAHRHGHSMVQTGPTDMATAWQRHDIDRAIILQQQSMVSSWAERRRTHAKHIQRVQGFSGFPLEENLLQQPNTHGDKYTSRSEGYHQSSCVHTNALERAWRLQLFSKHLMISKQTLPVYTRALV